MHWLYGIVRHLFVCPTTFAVVHIILIICMTPSGLTIINRSFVSNGLDLSSESPPREQRFCNNCSEKVIGDEMHFLLGCPKFVSERGRLFYDLGQLYGLRNNGDFLTFNLLMNYGFGDTHMAGKILKYVNECFNTWECKSWSEIIYVTITTGFCIIVCCLSLCLSCV